MKERARKFLRRSRMPGLLAARLQFSEEQILQVLQDYCKADISFGKLGYALNLDAWETYDLIEKLEGVCEEAGHDVN